MKRNVIRFIVVVFLTCVLLPFQGHSAAILYQYDKLNRLTSVTYGDGTRISYTYDLAGNLLSRTISKVVVPSKK